MGINIDLAGNGSEDEPVRVWSNSNEMYPERRLSIDKGSISNTGNEILSEVQDGVDDWQIHLRTNAGGPFPI